MEKASMGRPEGQLPAVYDVLRMGSSINGLTNCDMESAGSPIYSALGTQWITSLLQIAFSLY